MNTDQVKALLLQLEKMVPDFSLIFSGKESRKVNGLYKPDTMEIIIHNRNMERDDQIIYTAIHEFAHHIHYTSSQKPVSHRSHTTRFWEIFHRLLYRAEEKGIYSNPFSKVPELESLTKELKERFLQQNGNLMVEFAEKLMTAQGLCKEHGIRYEDYLDRALGLHRTEARQIMRIGQSGVNPALGFGNMKLVSGIKDPDQRRDAEHLLLEGKASPDMLRSAYKHKSPPPEPEDRTFVLEKRKERLEKEIMRLTEELEKVQSELSGAVAQT